MLGRAALASCLAIGYGMWAARLGISFDALEVEVQADYDVSGELGIADEVRPGYGAMRGRGDLVSSTSPQADVMRVLDTADRLSSYNDIFSKGVPLTREYASAPRQADVGRAPPARASSATAGTRRPRTTSPTGPRSFALPRIDCSNSPPSCPVSACSTWRAAPAS